LPASVHRKFTRSVSRGGRCRASGSQIAGALSMQEEIIKLKKAAASVQAIT